MNISKMSESLKDLEMSKAVLTDRLNAEREKNRAAAEVAEIRAAGTAKTTRSVRIVDDMLSALQVRQR